MFRTQRITNTHTLHRQQIHTPHIILRKHTAIYRLRQVVEGLVNAITSYIIKLSKNRERV